MKYILIHEHQCIGPFDEHEHVVDYVKKKRLFGTIEIRTLTRPIP